MTTTAPEKRSLEAEECRPTKVPRMEHPTTATKTLSDLPAEIIQQIFRLSQEPALIHTCRATYKALPSFQSHTQALVYIAYNTSPWQRHTTPVKEALRELGWPSLADWTMQDFGKLQQRIGSSQWLSATHLRRVYGMSWANVVEHWVLGSVDIELSEEDREKLKACCENARRDGTTVRASMDALINPRLLGQGGSVCRGTIDLGDNCVKNFCHGLNNVMAMISVESYIPDCLLSQGDQAAAQELLHVFLSIPVVPPTVACAVEPYRFERHAEVDSDDHYKLVCDGTLLADRIRDMIQIATHDPEGPQPRTQGGQRPVDQLSDLLILNATSNLLVPINFTMLQACIRHNLVGCLSLLLEKHILGFSKKEEVSSTESITELELVELCALPVSFQNRQCLAIVYAALQAINQLQVQAADRGYEDWQELAFAVRRGSTSFHQPADHVCSGCPEPSIEDETSDSEADDMD
jgi:hypothetical protein